MTQQGDVARPLCGSKYDVARSRRRPAAVLVAAVLTSLAYGGLSPDPVSAVPRGVVLGNVQRAELPKSASIVIGKNAATEGYSTKLVTISQDGQLSVVNLDSIDHTVTSVAIDDQGEPLFDVIVPPGSTVSVPAASTLAAGTYAFYCRFHPNMQGQLVVEGSSGGTPPSPPKFDQPLFVPDVVRSDRVRLTMRRTKERMLPHGARTPLWTYGGSWPGPTIRRPAGKDTKVTFVNALPRGAGSTTVHLHGDHHKAKDDGQPDRYLIRRGHARTYDFPLTYAREPEPSSFFFYHDHRMDKTSKNNWRGLQGMFILDDDRNSGLRLPRGRRDVPLLIADRSFTSSNRLKDPFRAGPRMVMSPDGGMAFKGPKAPPNDATVGTRILANGRFAPYLRVSATRYRLRLLNASNFSAYNFALSDGRPFVQIGTGNGLLRRPVVRQNILLGPAQRADVIVDFHRELGQNVILSSVPRTDGATTGTGSRIAAIMQFRVRRQADDPSRLPATLAAPRRIKPPTRIAKTWTFGLKGDATSGTFWSINGKAFDPERVDFRVPLGATQRWRLRNVSPVTHYVHIHAEQWHTVTRDGKRPPPWERGLEDTWRLDPGESVTVAAKFADYTGPFMIHCHMLDHEDHGMMAQFEVVPRG
jgi:spore coat protein A